ncbi:MAG: class I SAM-dependent methyltransferase [bacterium]
MNKKDSKITQKGVYDFFDYRQSGLPDANTLSGLGTAYKYNWLCKTIEALDFSNRPTKILDAGCGPGRIETIMNRDYKKLLDESDIFGIDIVDSLIEGCRELRLPNCSFLVYDGKKIPFEDDRFDVAFSVGVIEHVPDKVNYLNEIRRVLKPHGTLIISTPNPQCWGLNLSNHMYYGLRKLLRRKEICKDEFISLSSLSSLMKDSGFSFSGETVHFLWPRVFVSIENRPLLPPLPAGLMLLYQRFCMFVMLKCLYKQIPNFMKLRLFHTVAIVAKKIRLTEPIQETDRR